MVFTMAALPVNDSITLREDELEERFIHSPGPGGQHVNKAATGVQLRFDVHNSPSLPEPVRVRLNRLAGKRITKEGILVIEAHRNRSLQRNRQEARRRLLALIRRATHIPKTRHRTKPPRSAVERRLQRKRQQGQKKQQRQPPEY
jgi:ribosome-associated protein